ncbi:MAG: PqqD family protein, partial [Candidatus Aminicenantes bacterium]|nr:PqqD family protein [Candidatus Aminicenantes bacterium]
MISSNRFAFNQPHVVFESFEDEVVLINLASGNYYSADKVGKVVIEMLAEHSSPAEIVSGLAAKYNLSRVDIEPGINTFIEALLAEGLIVLAADQGPGAGAGEKRMAPPADGDRDFIPPLLRRYSDMQDLLLLDPIHEV